MARSRIGIWLIGAKGGVATTAITGLVALQEGPDRQRRPDHHHAAVRRAGPGRLGRLCCRRPRHPRRDVCTTKHCGCTRRAGRSTSAILDKCRADFDEIEKNLRPGTLLNVGADDQQVRQRGAAAAAAKRRGRRSSACKTTCASSSRPTSSTHVVVVNVSSTEPPVDPASLPERWADLNKLIDEPKSARCRPARCTRSRRSTWASRTSTSRRRWAARPRRFRSWRWTAAPGTMATTARPARRCSRARWRRCSPSGTWRS